MKGVVRGCKLGHGRASRSAGGALGACSSRSTTSAGEQEQEQNLLNR